MDKEFIKELLSTEDGTSEKLIKNGDFIDSELLGILGSATKKNLQKAFYLYKCGIPSGSYKYFVELKCPVCGSMHKKSVSKTKLMQILGYSSAYSQEKYIFHCDTCRIEQEEKDRIEKEKQNKACEENAKIRTKNYIENYLNINKRFKKELPINEKIDFIMGSFYGYGFSDEVKKAILKMDYYDFLQTPYWDGIRSYKLKRAKYCCELCGGKGILNVHHKTYEHHGLEHLRSVTDKDLIVLCKDCHEKFHDKLADKEVPA